MTIRSEAWILSAGVLGAVLLGIALWTVTLGPSATPAGAAAGVLAVISGCNRLLEIGYAFGDLLTGAGPVRNLQMFIGRIRDRAALAEPVEAKLVEVEDLSYSYPGASAPALCGVSLEIHSGQMIGIVGANGAGKTTLARCMIGAFHPNSGSVRINKIPLVDIGDASRLATFSVMAQDFGKYEFSVRESLALGCPDHEPTDSDLWDALSFAEADGFIRALPAGLDTQLGQQWGGVGLSGGQWQRLSLARIALKQAPVWVLGCVFHMFGEVRGMLVG